jgi:hypothetical protein
VLPQKWSRRQVEARLANMPPCLIAMEACVGAHHLSRNLKASGHDAQLMPAKYVRPYSKGQKNDFRDAEAIAGGSPTANDEVRNHEDRRAARFAGVAPGTLAIGQPAHRHYQSNPVLFFLSAALLSARVCGSCAPSCRASSPRHPMCCLTAWCVSLRVWPKTGTGSTTRGSNNCPARS